MTTQFLNFYISNLGMLSTEINRNRCSIQQLNENITALTSGVQQSLREFFKENLNADVAWQNCEINKIYSQIRKLQKCEAEKRLLTRQACDILDRFFESLDTKLKSAQTYHNFNANDQQVELLKILLSIKFELDHPAQGNAVIIDLMKKIDDEPKKPNAMDIEVFKTDEYIQSSQFFSNEMKDPENNDSSLMHPIDNLQEFTDKIRDICLGMKNRSRVDEPSNSDSDTQSSSDKEVSSQPPTEEDGELCHCRKESSGGMVFCDNSNCKTGWYHFECVGLYVPPVGLWFCPSCVIFENM